MILRRKANKLAQGIKTWNILVLTTLGLLCIKIQIGEHPVTIHPPYTPVSN